MVEKRIFVVSLIIFVSIVVLFNLVSVYFFGIPLSPVVITGKVVDEVTGIVKIYVEGPEKIITIYFPENTTYDNTSYTCATGSMSKCDHYRYILDLNVSADFSLENNSNWRYSLYDLKHDVMVNQSVVFTPNTSVAFVRWGNLLTVFVEEEDADWVNKSVIFTIDVPNSAPLIQNLSNKIFVCEGDRINSLNESYFNVFDIDEEDFFNPSSYNIDEGGTFALRHFPKIGYYITPFQIRSALFDKDDLRDHILDVSVWDSDGWLGTNVTNVTVIEINNVPEIYFNGVVDPDGIGAQRIWLSGPNSTFSYQLNVSDVEDGWSEDGNMTFNISESLGFTFNATTGAMNYTSQAGDIGPTYSIIVCATDNALASVHENFSICSGRGHSADNQSVCDNFTLTITDENRAPRIDAYSPVTLSFNVSGTTESFFNVTVSDDDMINAYPDIDWYVDDVLQIAEGSENKSSDDFSYTFGCGVSGNHTVTIVTSDGELNDSITWNITVINVVCPVESAGRPGGGGLGGYCNEEWSCHGWGLCQNAERSFNAGVLSSKDYSSTKDFCAQNLYEGNFCGFQMTKCFDLEMCNNSEIRVPKPEESRVCYFTEDPSCIDGITNCHDGDCELLVDCGGPCEPCPTCSDGKRNQGEGGVDCGGPCPFACEAERPFRAISFVLIGLLFLIFLLFIYILYKIFKIVRHRFFLMGEKNKKMNKR